MDINSLSNEDLMQIAGSPAKAASPFDFIPSWLQATPPPQQETPWDQQSLSQQFLGFDLPTFARAAIKTAPLNAGDKIQAALGALGSTAYAQVAEPDLVTALHQDTNHGITSQADPYNLALSNIQLGNSAAEQANPGSYVAGQFGGALATIPLLEAAGAPAFLTAPAASLPGRLAQNTALGAGFGYGGSSDNDKSLDTGVGALLGLGAGVGGELLSPLLKGLVPTSNSEANTASSAMASPSENAAATSGSISSTPIPSINNISPDIKVSFQDGLDHGLTPQQALIKAQGDKFGVRMAPGDYTQNVDLQGLEHLALTGSLGKENERTATEFVQGQKQDLQNMATDIAKQVGGGNAPINNYADIAANVQSKLQALNEQGRGEVNAAYDAANAEGKVSIPVKAFQPMQNAIDTIGNERLIDPTLTPATSKAVAKISNFLESNPDDGLLPFKTADNFRKVLNKYYDTAANNTDRGNIMILKNQLNNITDDAVTNGLASGNPNAITALKNANGVAKDYFDRFDSNKVIQTIIDKDMQPETVAKLLFGAGKLGGNTEAATVTNQLKSILGENSPEFQQIKQAGIDKLFYGNLPASSYASNPALAKNIAGQYSKNVDEFFNGNKSLANSLYSPGEQKTIIDSAEYIAKPISTKQPGAINNSGTFPVAARFGQALQRSGLPIIKEFGAVMKDRAILSRLTTHFEGGAIIPVVNSEAQLSIANALKQKLGSAVVAPAAAEENKLINSSANANPLSGISNEDLIKAAGSPTSQQQQPLPPIPVSQIQPTIQTPAAPSDNPVLSSINNASQATGVAAPLLHTIAAAESSMNPNASNPNSSAKGLFQMTSSTWKQMVNKYGQQFGIGMRDINDPQANATMAAMLTQDNASRMQNKLGRPPTTGEIYLAHFAGVQGAIKLMTADPDGKAASILPQAAKANRSIFFNGSKPKTVAEVYHDITGKVSDIAAPQAEVATSPAPPMTVIQKAAISAVPEVAREALLKNPDKAGEFDQMFGNGLAQLILQNK